MKSVSFADQLQQGNQLIPNFASQGLPVEADANFTSPSARGVALPTTTQSARTLPDFDRSSQSEPHEGRQDDGIGVDMVPSTVTISSQTERTLSTGSTCTVSPNDHHCASSGDLLSTVTSRASTTATRSVASLAAGRVAAAADDSHALMKKDADALRPDLQQPVMSGTRYPAINKPTTTELSSAMLDRRIAPPTTTTAGMNEEAQQESAEVENDDSIITRVTGKPFPTIQLTSVPVAPPRSGGRARTTTEYSDSLALVVYTGGQQNALVGSIPDAAETRWRHVRGAQISPGIGTDMRGEESRSSRQLITLPSPRITNSRGRDQHTSSASSPFVDGALSAPSEGSIGMNDRQSSSPPSNRTAGISIAGGSVSCRSTSIGEDTTTASPSSHQGNGALPGPETTLCTERDADDYRPSEWVVMSAAQVAETARKLELETEKNKALESTIQEQRRDRVIIYNAAMKHASRREEAFISEAKQSQAREQSAMRAEVDTEKQKISELYQERCRDYAQMVCDEREGEVTKKVADLRKDWARQKKTIAQLVQEEGEDQQVVVLARAIMEQLGEERKEEIQGIREEIYAEVKAEFEAREVAMTDVLRSEHEADLEGQLLLAEIRHQQNLDRLRAELTDSAIGSPSDEAAVRSIVPYQPGTNPSQTRVDGSVGAQSNSRRRTPPPSFARSIRVTGSGNASNGDRLGDGGRRGVQGTSGSQRGLLGGGKCGLAGKLPAFKVPMQKRSPGRDTNNGEDNGSKMDKASTKKMSSEASTAAKPSSSQAPARTKNTSRLATGTGKKRSGNTLHSTDITVDTEEGITSTLMVSPIKSGARILTVTPSTEALTEGPPRPKKRGKKLFASGS